MARDRVLPGVPDLGTGSALQQTLPPGARGIGIDRESCFLERRVTTPIAFIRGDAGELPIRSGSCDRVLCTSLFQYLESQEKALAVLTELIRALRPGGRLLVADLLDRTRKGWLPTTAHRRDSAFHRPGLTLLQAPVSALFYHLLRWYEPPALLEHVASAGSTGRMVARPPALVNAHECFDLLITKP